MSRRERQRRRRRNEGSASRVIFVFLGLVVTGVAIAGIAAVAWVINVANSAPSLDDQEADRARRDLARLRGRRQDAAGLHQRQHPAHAGALRRDPRRRPRGDGRDRGPALLRAPGRGLRGHRPRRGQEPRVQEGHPGRLDADHAARAQPLHGRARAQRAWPATSARSARPSWPRSSRTAIPAAPASCGSSTSTSTRCPTAPWAGRPRSASRPPRASSSTSRPSRLTLREAALLAGLPQAPSNYNPFLDKGAATARRNDVLQRMADQGYITQARPTRRWR